MKKYALDFLKRGLMAAGGGPVILALVYGGLEGNGIISSFQPFRICMEILTVTLMAFVAGGISVVYSIEKLPLLHATLIHAIVLYADYLLVYLTNEWIPRNGVGIGIFTLIYAAGYALIWLCVCCAIKLRIYRMNKSLKGRKA